MMKYVGFFLGCLILFSSEVFVWSRFYDKKINFKNFWLYLSVFLLSLIGMFNHIFINAFIKVLIITILMCIFNYLLFKKKLNETLISVIYGQFIVVFADALGVIVLVLFIGGDTISVKNNFFDTLIGNFIVSFIYICICCIPIVKKIYMKLVEFTNKFKVKNTILLSLLIIISINFLVALIYYDLKSIFVVIINSLLILFYSFIIYKAMNEKNNSIKVNAENQSLMESLHQYEDMVDRQRVDNHENKNQLLIIKNMIKKKDKDVVKYIETIVKDQKEDDEALYTKVMSIPSGGLQGIIYQKMLVMKDEKILFSLDVSREVRSINLDFFNGEDNYNLCRIVGVLLDNAIEESKDVQDKCIMICLYVDDDNLVIDISNKCNGCVDIDKLDDEGYTTKGDGHGYGLSLVKKIISESDKFENEKSMKKNVFKQVIKVKIKNT